MTAHDVARALARRWYVLLVAILCGSALSAALAYNGGLYTTRTVIQFIRLAPAHVAIGPGIGIDDEDFVSFAGAVASEVNNGRPISRYAWEDAPLYGAGIREGVLVGLPDTGGQWMTSFNRAEIEIQVVGYTQDYVEQRQAELVQKVFDSSRSLQGPIYNNQDQRIRTLVSPLTSTIEHVSASRSQQGIAFLLILTAALIVGGWLAVRIDLVVSRRAQQRAQAYLQATATPGPPAEVS